MSEAGTPESHGVHGAEREDGKMQEEPSATGGVDDEPGAEPTETGPTTT